MLFVTFCRFTIAILFSYSFLSKILNINQFAQTISSFKLLPSKLSTKIAFLVLTGELGIVGMILAGPSYLPFAFMAASVLLTGFSLALGWVLFKNIQTPCNCFGNSKNKVTVYDLIRNIGLLICTVLAGIVCTTNYIQPISIFEWAIIALFSLIFVALMTNVNSIVLTLKALQKIS